MRERIMDDNRVKKVRIRGEYAIKLDDRIVAKGRNKWTRYFVSSLCEVMVTDRKRITGSSGPSPRFIGAAGLSYRYTARAGSDTSTRTSYDMTDLVSKLDYEPDTKNRVLFKDANYSNYRVRFKFTWNPGTIPAGIIGEFGVYLWLTDDAWTSPAENANFGWYGNYRALAVDNPTLRLAARISSADGHFSPIDYDGQESVTLEWYVTVV